MSFYAHPEFWVLVAVIAFFVLLIALKVPGAVAASLDSRAAKIQAELDEAQRLRAEGEQLLAQIRTQREETERAAAEMLAQAKTDAERLRVEAAAKLEEQVARRAALAEQKIATAEAQATAEVRAAAVDLAAKAAETVLAQRLAGTVTDPLIDAGISGLAAKLQ